jgi:hypothetical protein
MKYSIWYLTIILFLGIPTILIALIYLIVSTINLQVIVLFIYLNDRSMINKKVYFHIMKSNYKTIYNTLF